MILICTWAICLSINSHNYCASWLQSSRFCLTKKRLFLRCFFVKEYENAVFHISMRPLSFTFENGVCRRPSMDAAFRYFTLKSKSRNFKSNSWLETWDRAFNIMRCSLVQNWFYHFIFLLQNPRSKISDLLKIHRHAIYRNLVGFTTMYH